MYDVAIVGGGPAGLMAAVTAAQQGLKTVLVEKRRDVSRITRACSMQFIMDDGYENECIRLEEGKIVFTRNGFGVDYSGPLHSLTDKYFVSPAGCKVHFAHGDKRPFSIKFDKGVLLHGLWQRCAKAGVDLLAGSVAYDADDGDAGITLRLTSAGKHSSLRARKLIAADGATALMAEALGLNRDRRLFMVALCMIYLVEGLRNYDPAVWTKYMGMAYSPQAGFIVAPALEEGIAEVVVGGRNTMSMDQVYREISTTCKLAPLFAEARVVDRVGCSLKAFDSLKVPYRGNALVIGDAAAYVEVETQGALMCGHHAGKAVAAELDGRDGFDRYTRWWQESFEFNGEDYLQVAQGYALSPYYTDEELDYLFALTADQVLEGTYSQYTSPRLMWNCILRHRERIRKDRPEIYAKISKNRELTLA